MKNHQKDRIVVPVVYMKKLENVKELSGVKIRVSESDLNSDNHSILVLPRASVDWSVQLEEYGIECQLLMENFSNISERKIPYILTFEISELTGISPNDARKATEKGKRGLNIEEGIALAYQHPELLEDRSIDLIASKYKSECTPTIYKWNGKIRLSAICSDVADPMCGPAFVRKIQNV